MYKVISATDPVMLESEVNRIMEENPGNWVVLGAPVVSTFREQREAHLFVQDHFHQSLFRMPTPVQLPQN